MNRYASATALALLTPPQRKDRRLPILFWRKPAPSGVEGGMPGFEYPAGIETIDIMPKIDGKCLYLSTGGKPCR